MANPEGHFASIILRLTTLLAFSLLYVFAGMVIIENRELHKMLSPTVARSMMLLLGYCGAIVSMNYYLGIRAQNFTDWRTELLLISFFVVLVLGWLGGYLFPLTITVPAPFWKFWASEVMHPPDARFMLFWVLLVPIGTGSYLRLRRLHQSSGEKG